METRARKKTLNIIMVVLIAIIVGCGIMAVGHIQGWFGAEETAGSNMTSDSITGVVNVERSGIGYSLDEDVSVQPQDIVDTRTGSEASFRFGDGNGLALNEKTEMEISDCEDENVGFKLNEGELFAEVPKSPENFSVAFGKNSAVITGTVFSLSVRSGSSTLSVYEGSVRVRAEDGSDKDVKAGQSILITRNGNDELAIDISDIKATSLSDYMIGKLLDVESSDLCFSSKELNSVKTAREKEKQKAAKTLEDKAIEIAQQQEGGSPGTGDAKAGSDPGSSSNSGQGGSSASEVESGSSSSDVMKCTISIRCKTILNNMDKLKSGKNRYVPSNGIILTTSPVEFIKGETAYDVTKRACSATGIQIEASYSPVYGSYYVEGINHLYEFDCGEMSGWLYKINGWTPNYGCSEYTLKNGDSIVWDYTCTGN